jgi:predicted aspartyl protease
LSAGFLLAGTRDGGASRNKKRNPSTTSYASPISPNPIYINVQVNNKQQHAIIDTGSAVTIISQQLLQKINHKKFTHKPKIHKSANCTSINIIGEIQLEVKIQGYQTSITADVAANLVTDLLLGNDWIQQNNVIINSPQQRILITNKYHRIIVSTPFIEPPDHTLPILLIDEITLPPYSEKCVDVKILSPIKNDTDVLFEPTLNLNSKQILLANALLKMKNNKTKIIIINANDHQRTLSRNTKLGTISYQAESNNYLVLPILPNKTVDRLPQSLKLCSPTTYKRNNNTLVGRSCAQKIPEKRKVQFADVSCHIKHNDIQNHQCYNCQEQFLSRNDLQQHLRQKCYPSEMREQIENLTQHIEDVKQRQQVQHILWKYGKLFDLRQPSIIKATVYQAIETGNHPPVYTSPYRVSYRDQQIQQEEINKLLQQGVIEESTSPWSSPIVLVRKKDGSVRFCIDFRNLTTLQQKMHFLFLELMIFLIICPKPNFIPQSISNPVIFKLDLIRKIAQKQHFLLEINIFSLPYYRKVLLMVHLHFNVLLVKYLDQHDGNIHWPISMT